MKTQIRVVGKWVVALRSDGMRIDYEMTLDHLRHLAAAEPDGLTLDGRALVWKEEEGVGRMVLPLLFPLPASGIGSASELADYVDELPELPPSHVVVLMRAGTASLGYWFEGELAQHKVIRKYMVRKKQGRMQIAYLSSKGKSRAGSRVRLRESLEFFEEINEKLTEWFDLAGEPELIFHSCPVRLKTHWFSSKVAPPFPSDDERLVHVPYHVHQPDHEELLRIHRLLASGAIETG